MKKPTADALKEAREKLAVAREQRSKAQEAADAIAARLTDPAWDEATDGPALETETRNLKTRNALWTIWRVAWKPSQPTSLLSSVAWVERPAYR